VEDIDVVCIPIGWQPIQLMKEEKPIDQFLMLIVNMEVSLLHGDGLDLRCVGVGVIVKCSPKGNWEGFLVPHSFFLVVLLNIVNHDFHKLSTYCDDSS